MYGPPRRSVVGGCRSGIDELDDDSAAHRLPVGGVALGCCFQPDLDVGPRVITLPLAGEGGTGYGRGAALGVLEVDDVTVGREVRVGVHELHAHLAGVRDEPYAEPLDRRGVVVVELLGLGDIGVGASTSVDGGVSRACDGHETSRSKYRHRCGRDNVSQHVLLQSGKGRGVLHKKCTR